ncbi:hypothetical protein EDB84DRAFT_1447341 [Lactarius hengduanensis]|nr:hypothetical protein EDB84DRAFT_1447341 [Lactarius hengduanensis]
MELMAEHWLNLMWFARSGIVLQYHLASLVLLYMSPNQPAFTLLAIPPQQRALVVPHGHTFANSEPIPVAWVPAGTYPFSPVPSHWTFLLLDYAYARNQGIFPTFGLLRAALYSHGRQDHPFSESSFNVEIILSWYSHGTTRGRVLQKPDRDRATPQRSLQERNLLYHPPRLATTTRLRRLAMANGSRLITRHAHDAPYRPSNDQSDNGLALPPATMMSPTACRPMILLREGLYDYDLCYTPAPPKGKARATSRAWIESDGGDEDGSDGRAEDDAAARGPG